MNISDSYFDIKLYIINSVINIILSSLLNSIEVLFVCGVVRRSAMPLFGVKHKTPQELVKLVRDGLAVLNQPDIKDEKKTQKVFHTL